MSLERVWVSGELRKIQYSGIGPFRRSKVEAIPFKVNLCAGEVAEPIPGLNLVARAIDQGIEVGGRLKGVLCIFAQLTEDGPATVKFSMLSVARHELHGAASREEPSDPRPRKGGRRSRR